MAKVFFSYSHDDEAYRDQLEKHLALLRHEGLIESWHDRRILAGADLNQVIDDQLNQADVILLLV
ncbi:TIR domain-containing protein, partial [Acinetobacter baumannii]